MRILDLFAGPGGWDVAAHELGLDPLGIEWDDAACATRRARGLSTEQADVAELDPADYPCDLLIASPPCQAWSMAGKRGGEKDIKRVYALSNNLAALGIKGPEMEWEDPRSELVCEPLRWALKLRPKYIALEQVPPVLDYWKWVSAALRTYDDYRTWVGILSAECYGVPQTRKRAILMASRVGSVTPPEPTHQAYVSGQPAERQDGLFGSLEPWVSMAEALGWGMTERPGMTFAPGTSRGGVAMEGGSGARAILQREQREGRWMWTRPATTVQGDPRIAEPGWRGRPEDYSEDGTYNGTSQGTHAIRVSIEEASILQGFPPDYPWQGTRTKQFEQAGNAVPPPLAKAILSELLP